jgi:S-adenosylmethionine:tRNA-ribosyltransferase-isomerase (queuine synthetase)
VNSFEKTLKLFEYRIPECQIRPYYDGWEKDVKLVIFEVKGGRIYTKPFAFISEILNGELCYANNAALKRESIHCGRHQPIYASELGPWGGTWISPTSGLPFTQEILSKMNLKFLSLFTPQNRRSTKEMYEQVKTWDEYYRVDNPPDKPVVAIGTTVVKTLETRAKTGVNFGNSDLMITHDYKLKLVKALLTNFHYSKEPHNLMISALAGVEGTVEIYKYAIANKIQFINFGDRLLVLGA